MFAKSSRHARRRLAQWRVVRLAYALALPAQGEGQYYSARTPAIATDCLAPWPRPSPASWLAWPPTLRLSAHAYLRLVQDESRKGRYRPTGAARFPEGLARSSR